MRILLASTAGAGHVGPLLPFASACIEAGHDVLVAVPPGGAPAAEGAGLPVHVLPEPPVGELGHFWARVPELSPEEANREVVAEVFARINVKATLPGHRAAIRGWRPDLVVRETNEYGAALAAELEGVAHARLNVGLASTEALAFAVAAPVLDGLRRAHGLPPDPGAAALRDAPYLTWYPRSLEDPAHPGPEDALRLHDPAWDAPADPLPPGWWPDELADAPLVYVTFGSVAGSFARSVPVYGMAMEAVAALPVRVLLTVGRNVDLAALPTAPRNVRVERWVPQATALAHATAAVCHGGAGSTLGALAAGRPLVAVPLFADQPLNAERVAATGAGLSVAPDPAGVRAAIERVLAEPAYAARARAIATEMRGHRPAAEGAEALAPAAA